MFMDSNKRREAVEPEKTILHHSDVEFVLQELLALYQEESGDIDEINIHNLVLTGLDRRDRNKHSNEVYS
jgi:hypothetical protein